LGKKNLGALPKVWFGPELGGNISPDWEGFFVEFRPSFNWGCAQKFLTLWGFYPGLMGNLMGLFPKLALGVALLKFWPFPFGV